jgi:DNA-binding transcriptional MerR regulator
MAESFSIAELAAEFGVTNRTVRFYEDEGLISPERAGTRRIYSQRDRTRLRLIMRGKRLGFSIQEIREILDLYDMEAGEVGQLSHFIEKIAERRKHLEQQRKDIAAILDELKRIEEGCVERLETLKTQNKKKAKTKATDDDKDKRQFDLLLG